MKAIKHIVFIINIHDCTLSNATYILIAQLKKVLLAHAMCVDIIKFKSITIIILVIT